MNFMFYQIPCKHSIFGQIRVTVIRYQQWFIGEDVATALGYEDPAAAIQEYVPCEDRGRILINTPEGECRVAMINEAGLYALIFSSKLPEIKQFKHWVTTYLIPEIRRVAGANTSIPHLRFPRRAVESQETRE